MNLTATNALKPNEKYGTHLPYLVQAVKKLRPKFVLELGIGWFSTPILSALSDGLFDILSLDSDPMWVEQFEYLETHYHTIKTQDWKTFQPEEEFDLCLVDSAPIESRKPLIQQLKNQVGVFVLHDAEDARYHYQALYPEFNFVKICDALYPWTALCSDTVDVTRWRKL